jgi:uncharacterized protein
MVRQDKKEQLKLIIQEFHELSLPEVFDRELTVPLNSRKIVTIHGPRRSGKSFYFYLLTKKLLGTGVLKERIVYINFEDDRILPLSAQDLNLVPEAYFELYPEYKDKKIYFFFDEIQNVPNWEVFVRRLYDKESVQLFVTGSSSKLLPKEH